MARCSILARTGADEPLSAVEFSVLDCSCRLRRACILMLGAWPAFVLAQSATHIGLVSAGIILALGQGLFVGPMCAAMAALLPSYVRVTGIGLGYSFSVGIFGGLAPMLTEYLLSRQQLIMAPAIVVIAGALISWAALCFNSAWRHSTENLPEDQKEQA